MPSAWDAMGYHGFLWEVNDSKVKVPVKNCFLLYSLNIPNLVISSNTITNYGVFELISALHE